MSDENKPVLHVFYSHIPNSKYIFANGTEAPFTAGRYATDDPILIAELNREIAKGHRYIFTDPNKLTVTAEELDPMHEIRKKIIAEYEASKLVQTDAGTSDQGKFNPSSTSDLGEIAGAIKVTPQTTPPVNMVNLLAKDKADSK